MLIRLTMICSGATLAMRKGCFPLDEPLEQRSRLLALAMGPDLRRADRFWMGPALRARQTAEALSLRPSTEPLLAEQDYGSWAGKSFKEIHEEQPENIAAWLRDPDAAPHGGESLADVAHRASRLLDSLMRERGHTIVVTHAGVIRAAMIHVLGAPLSACRRIDVEPLSITEFRSDGHRWMLRASGVTGAKAAEVKREVTRNPT